MTTTIDPFVGALEAERAALEAERDACNREIEPIRARRAAVVGKLAAVESRLAARRRLAALSPFERDALAREMGTLLGVEAAESRADVRGVRTA